MRRRLDVESPQVPDSVDWPPGALPDETAWSALVGWLFETGGALCDAVRRFLPERCHERRPRADDTWYALISGELQHVLCHAGQIAIVKRSTGRTGGG